MPVSIWFSEIRHLMSGEELRLHTALRNAAATESPGSLKLRAFDRLEGFRRDMVEKYARRVDVARVFQPDAPPPPPAFRGESRDKAARDAATFEGSGSFLTGPEGSSRIW